MPATQIDGPLWIGAAGPTPATDPSAKGGYQTTPGYRYSYQPTALLTDNIAATQSTAGAFTLSAATGVTTTTIGGVNYIDLAPGVPLPLGERNIRFSGTASATAAVVTVAGLDGNLRVVQETVTSPSGAAITSGIKTLRFVRSATAAASTGSCSIGTGDRLGFPLRVNDPSQVQISMAGAWITAATGFVSAVTTTATALTGPVRGAYDLQTASDGTRRFTAIIYPADPDTTTGLYGVSQFAG